MKRHIKIEKMVECTGEGNSIPMRTKMAIIGEAFIDQEA
jgi:hypothetical protein